MSYYGQGDYYGQGGPFDFVKRAVGTVARGAIGFATGGVGGAIAAVAPRPRLSTISNPTMPIGPTVQIPTPGGRSFQIDPMAALPGGNPLFSMVGGKKRRTMNVGNIKALRRAVRRQDGFVRAVRSSLKHTNYTLVTKGSRSKGRSRGNVFVETGAGGIRA